MHFYSKQDEFELLIKKVRKNFLFRTSGSYSLITLKH